jgi:outer membrane protein assembly factor BamB
MKARKIFSSLLLLLAPGLLCPGWSQADYLTERWASFAYIFYQLDTVTGSPAIGVDGSIYARTEHDYVFALRRNGKVKWTSTSADGNSFRCSPAIAPSGDIIIHTSVRLYAHNQEDGSVTCTAYPDGGNSFEGAPAISKEGTVYIQCR